MLTSPLTALFRFAVILMASLASALPAIAQPEAPVEVSVEVNRTGVRPGDQFVIAVIFNHADGWHIHTNDPKPPFSWQGFVAIPTEILVADSPQFTIGATQWPKSHDVLLDLGGTGRPEPYGVFEGQAIAYVPVTVKADAVGPLSIALTIKYQACDDRVCVFPETVDHVVEQKMLGAGEASVATSAPELFQAFDVASFAAAAPVKPDARTIKFTEFGLDWEFSTLGLGLALLIFLSLLGGFVLNFTPCVLPVIPLKIMGLAQHAGNPRRALLMGGIMSLGVVAFWLTIGVLMVSLTQFKAINQLFQNAWFTIGVGVFIFIMAVGMFGLFTVRLPQFVYFLDPKSDTMSGGFLFGVMTAVLATPCTAPFMGTAAAWAVKQPPILTLAVFVSIGAGMAMPYLVLAAFPNLLAKVPRSGPGSDALKQILGLMMLGVATFFLGTGIDPLVRLPIDEPIRWFWWAVVVFAIIAGLWMIVSVFRFARSPILKSFVTAFALAIIAVSVPAGIRLTERSPIDWKGYTPHRFEAAQAEGKVIVIDFTAEWCLNCKTLENTVLHKDAIVALLNGPGVVALRVDLTGSNPDGQAKLKELNWVGIPLLAIYGPGYAEPVKYDWYTPDMVAAAVEGGRAKTALRGGQ